MAFTLADRAKMTIASISSTPATGKGPITVSVASAGYQTFADAGVSDGDTVSYVIEEGTTWETGLGTYSSTGPTLTRTTPSAGSAATPVAFTTAAEVFLTALAVDIDRGPYGPTPVAGELFNGANVTTSQGNSNAVAAADRTYAFPFSYTGADTITVDAAYIEVQTAGTAGSKAAVGLYTRSATGRPGTLLAEALNFDVASTGSKTVTFGSAYSLSAGNYFVVVVADAAITLEGYDNADVTDPGLGRSTGTFPWATTSLRTDDVSFVPSTGLPSDGETGVTWTTVNNALHHHIHLRRQA